GPPPRMSTEATAGSSNTTAVAPEPSRASCACPTRTPATSVIKFCQDIPYYQEILLPGSLLRSHGRQPTICGHSQCLSHRCHDAVGGLPLASCWSHLGAHDRRCLRPGRPLCGPDQLFVTLRAAAGAALSGVPGRLIAGTACGCRARAPGQARC